MKAPPGTCDAHLHIIDPRFPSAQTARPDGMTLDDYRLLQRRLGTIRAVPVQAKYYGTDNTCLLDTLSKLGADGRGIAVVSSDVTDAELRRLDHGGVRGLRFSIWNPADTVTTIDIIEPLAKRIAGLEWHVQLHMSANQIVDAAPMLQRLPSDRVRPHGPAPAPSRARPLCLQDHGGLVGATSSLVHT